MSRHPKGGFDAFMQWSQSKRTKPVDVEQSDLTGNFLNSGQQQYLKQQFTSPVAAVHPMQSVQQQMQRPVQKQQPVYNMQPPALQFLKPQPTHHMQPSGAQQNFPVRQQQFPAPSHASPNAAYSGIKAPSVNDSNSNYQPPSPSKLINSVLQTHSAPQTSSAVESGDWADTIPVAASKQETSRPPSTTRSSGTDQRIPVSSSKHLRRPSNGTSLTTQEAAMSKFLSVNDVINISDELSKLVGDTMSLLANVTDKDKEAEAAAEAAELKHREETKAKREEERLRMQNLITRLEHEKMPRWRHVQLGHDLKLLPPGMILKGKDLFRCVAYAVLKLYSKPLLMVRKKHLAARKIERDDLQKTLRLYLDPCSSWLAKIVKIPMISIQKDPTLNFSLAWDVFESKQHFNVRMLQLKVSKGDCIFLSIVFISFPLVMLFLLVMSYWLIIIMLHVCIRFGPSLSLIV